MERKAALANLTCSKRQEAAPAAGRATVEVRPDLNSFQISATTLAKVVRARSEATHATATWRMPLPCPPAHLVLASLLLIFFGHAARASISPPGAVAHMHAVESAGQDKRLGGWGHCAPQLGPVSLRFAREHLCPSSHAREAQQRVHAWGPCKVASPASAPQDTQMRGNRGQQIGFSGTRFPTAGIPSTFPPRSSP